MEGIVDHYSNRELDDTFTSGFDADARLRSMGRFADNGATERIPHYSPGDDGYSERSHYANLFRFLHPYAVLRTLAECPANLREEVVWQYDPLVSAGCANGDEFEPEARRTQTFLIATEGSSDTHILKHAFALMRPDIADFFRFVDMSDGYPFTGTGNLRNFAVGLAGIDVHNQVLFVLDNDAEGRDACANRAPTASHEHARNVPARPRGAPGHPRPWTRWASRFRPQRSRRRDRVLP